MQFYFLPPDGTKAWLDGAWNDRQAQMETSVISCDSCHVSGVVAHRKVSCEPLLSGSAGIFFFMHASSLFPPMIPREKLNHVYNFLSYGVIQLKQCGWCWWEEIQRITLDDVLHQFLQTFVSADWQKKGLRILTLRPVLQNDLSFKDLWKCMTFWWTK